MSNLGRPPKSPAERAKQFNVRLPQDVVSFLTGKENKSKLIVEAVRKQYKIGKRKRSYKK